ncbi:MAG TPA: ubiquitin-like small modifier protein 1 [Candidatus Limnocylindria bacterium]|nr:ubiquitin-like small modifier protein 1 [Candidatus Limnocylindria bacterium]
MPVSVRLYGAYSGFAGGAREAKVAGRTLREALDSLVAAHPSLRERIRDEHGRLREHLNVYVNKDDMRFLEGESTPVRDGDVIHVIPAVSGGR